MTDNNTVPDLAKEPQQNNPSYRRRKYKGVVVRVPEPRLPRHTKIISFLRFLITQIRQFLRNEYGQA